MRIFLISFSVFLLLLGSYLTIPFLTITLNSINSSFSSSFIGFLISLRFFISLLFIIINGYLSDIYNRKIILYIGLLFSILSCLIYLYKVNQFNFFCYYFISCFNQNIGIFKAYIIDYVHEKKISNDIKSKYLSYIGIASGSAFFIAPYIAPYLASNLQDIMKYSIFMYILTFVIYLQIPSNISSNKSSNISLSSSFSMSMSTIISTTIQLLNSSSSLTIFLLSTRFLMGVAYGIFNTSFNLYLIKKYSFTAQDHGSYMSWIGLTYIISQVVGPYILSSIRSQFPNSSPIILFCCSILIAFGRLVAVYTNDVMIIYFSTFIFGNGVGVINIILAEGASFATKQTGTIYSAMEAIEKIAGLFGPLIGGWLYKISHVHPVYVVAIIYFFIGSMSLYLNLNFTSNLRNSQSKKQRGNNNDNNRNNDSSNVNVKIRRKGTSIRKVK